MKGPVRARRFAVLLFAAILAGCAVVPAQEMSDARLAVQAAREAGAERYSSEWLEVAGDELVEAEDAIAAQAFESARQHARVARGLALAARNMALLAARQDGATVPLAEDARATTTALVEASRRASASGDTEKAARLADQAARVSGVAAPTD